MDLVKRIKEECAGVYYGGDQFAAPKQDLFGVANDCPLYLCLPREHISKISLGYWKIPKSLRKRMFSHEGESVEMRSRQGVYFFHYPVHPNKLARKMKQNGFGLPVDEQIFGRRNGDSSCVYSNLFSET